MTLALSGQIVEPGIAIGQAHNIQRNEIEIGEYRIGEEQVEAEISRLLHAADEAGARLRELAKRLRKAAGASSEEIIRTHIAMLEDSSLVQAAARHIREQLCNAEWALQLQLEHLVAEFRTIDDAYIRSREDDVPRWCAWCSNSWRPNNRTSPSGTFPIGLDRPWWSRKS